VRLPVRAGGSPSVADAIAEGWPRFHNWAHSLEGFVARKIVRSSLSIPEGDTSRFSLAGNLAGL
jgi:hypothetical protein